MSSTTGPLATNTRLNSGCAILSCNVGRLHALTNRCVLEHAGYKNNINQLQNVLEIKLWFYAHDHKKPMATPLSTQLLGNTLHMKRFFPYYAFNVVAGPDSEGKGLCTHTTSSSCLSRPRAWQVGVSRRS